MPVKWIKLVAKIALALSILLITAHSVATLVLEYRVRAKIAAIRAKGEPASLADLHGKKIPDSENAAVIYDRIFKDSSSTAFMLLTSPNWMDQRKTNPQLWNEGREELAKKEGIIRDVEAATSLPGCQFPVAADKHDWEVLNGLLFFRTGGLRHLARLLWVNAVFHAAEGDMDEAIRSVELGFKLSDSLKDDPYLPRQLLRVALIRIASRSLQEALQCGGINEKQAERLSDVLGRIRIDFDPVSHVVSERAIALYEFECIRRVGFPDVPAESILSGPGGPNHPWRFMSTYVGRPFLYAYELSYLDRESCRIEIVRSCKVLRCEELDSRPYHSGKADERELLRHLGRIKTTFYTGKAHVAGSQILLALAAYKDRFGTYPENLDELRSALGWKLPEDPFSGRDFLYKLQGNGFLLYSVGLNLKDDGGTEDYIKINKNDREQADIIWRMAGDG